MLSRANPTVVIPDRRAPLTSVFPAKAGTQIHPERFVGFTWAPAFAGETEEGERGEELAPYPPLPLNRHFNASTAPDISRQAVLEAITGQALTSTP